MPTHQKIYYAWLTPDVIEYSPNVGLLWQNSYKHLNTFPSTVDDISHVERGLQDHWMFSLDV